MSDADVIDLSVRRRARALAESGGGEGAAPDSLESAALHLFEAVTDALRDGADPQEVDRLVTRMDRVLGHLDRA